LAWLISPSLNDPKVSRRAFAEAATRLALPKRLREGDAGRQISSITLINALIFCVNQGDPQEM